MIRFHFLVICAAISEQISTQGSACSASASLHWTCILCLHFVVDNSFLPLQCDSWIIAVTHQQFRAVMTILGHGTTKWAVALECGAALHSIALAAADGLVRAPDYAWRVDP